LWREYRLFRRGVSTHPCDDRTDPVIAREILEFMERHGVLSVAMSDAIIGCPHQEGIDYEGEWCPVCEFWRGRDRFTGHKIQ